MITDQFTAKLLGAIVLLMVFTIDVGCFFFTKPEISHRPTFPLVVLVPSILPALFAAHLFRKASKMKADQD